MRGVPKVIGEQTRFLQLNPVMSLSPGDVLIQKEWSADGVTVGQAIFSHVSDGAMSARHAVLVVKNGNAIHATSHGGTSGIVKTWIGTLNESHEVYRCIDRNLADRACDVAEALVGGGFSNGKAFTSVLRLKVKGPLGNRHIKDLHSKILGNAGGTFTRPKMFCSELVATAYEIAAYDIGTAALDKDPRGLSVKALESALHHSPMFTLVGRWN